MHVLTGAYRRKGKDLPKHHRECKGLCRRVLISAEKERPVSKAFLEERRRIEAMHGEEK